MKVYFNEAARDDIARNHSYIHERNPAAAAKVVFAIRSSTNRLVSFPYSGRMGAVTGTREIVVPHLPYIVVYAVKFGYVEIIAAFHAAEDRPRG